MSSWFVAGNWMLMLNHPLTSTGHWNHLPSLGGFVLNFRSSTELQVRHSPNKSLTHNIYHGKAIIRQLNCCPYPTGLFQRMSLFVFLSYLSKFSLTFWSLGYNCVRQKWGQMRFPALSGGVRSQNVLWLADECLLNLAQQHTHTQTHIYTYKYFSMCLS